jgi:hypothetical protein
VTFEAALLQERLGAQRTGVLLVRLVRERVVLEVSDGLERFSTDRAEVRAGLLCVSLGVRPEEPLGGERLAADAADVLLLGGGVVVVLAVEVPEVSLEILEEVQLEATVVATAKKQKKTLK